MKKCVFLLLVLVSCTAVAQHQFVPRQIVLTWRYSLGPEPPIIPDSYDEVLTWSGTSDYSGFVR